jgi:hypothetical protein
MLLFGDSLNHVLRQGSQSSIQIAQGAEDEALLTQEAKDRLSCPDGRQR